MTIFTLGPMGDDRISEVAREAGVSDGQVDSITELAEGNPGAVMVLAALVNGGHSDSLARFAAAQLCGVRIWVAFKYVCGQHVDVLVARLAQDPSALVRDVAGTGRA